ncbi:MAG TPA: sigma-70 family RNA polymerase sigma factor [Kiloniellales bacterium]|nr:sigma-70 family RNA polymerase sigma factor [Kiloniellales bacterium]
MAVTEPGDRLAEPEAIEGFLATRPQLFGLAYRMLGSVAEAEDVVQEAFLRWQAVDRAAVKNARAFLVRVVTRLCLDHLKSARVRREEYVGPWLPEPLVTFVEEGEEAAFAQDHSTALLLALERLSPLERAAFLLHDIFEMDFVEIADLLDRSPAACRQLAVRARSNLRHEKRRFPVPPAEAAAIVAAFNRASREGDLQALRDLLAEDVVLHTDGGGRRASALNLLTGWKKVARFYEGLARKGLISQPVTERFAWINGNPGLLTLEKDGLPQSIGLDVRGGRIHAIYVVRNPEKLGHVVLAPIQGAC